MTTQAQVTDPRSDFVDKLPQVTAIFWLMKITATTLGETGGDWLSMTMNLGYMASTLIFFALFLVAVAVQLMSTRHHAFLFWTVIITTSTAGTTMSDYIDRTLHFGYAKGAATLLITLMCVLAVWRYTIGSLAVDAIRTRRAEAFYWLAILVSNTLGTATGDFLSDDSGLGFLGSWLLVTGALAVILAAAVFTRLSRVVLFWTAFISTRPFGATFGDVLTKKPEAGGLDLGTGYSSLVLLAILVVTVLVAHRVRS